MSDGPDRNALQARRLEWDAAKRASNLAAHHVDFEAVRRFDWERATLVVDDRAPYGEERIIAVGPIDGRLHVLIYTLRGDAVRVISLRKANDREQRRWGARIASS